MKPNNVSMMKCGHAANALTGPPPGMPCCAICGPNGEGWNVVDDSYLYLENRRAQCHYYGMTTRHNECNFGGEGDKVCRCEQPSDPTHLPFFEYLGPGSPLRLCKHCGLGIGAHRAGDYACPTRYNNRGKPGEIIPGSEKWHGKTYEAKEYKFDSFYCGCHGWN